MSVNQRFGIDQEKTKRLGKMFHTIDFESNPDYSNSNYREKSKHTPCGSFYIDGKEFKITIHELSRICETAEVALESLKKNYKMGGMAFR
jgi:hypothetical protein